MTKCVFNTPAYWQCHDWKPGEYMALGKAIVSTPLSNDLPAPLLHGEQMKDYRFLLKNFYPKELLWWDWAASQWPIFYKQICRYSSNGIMTDCVRNNIVKKDCFVIKDPKRELLLFAVEEFLKSI